MRKLTAPPDLKILGAMTVTYVDNLQSQETKPVFEKHNLVDLDPNGWYPADKFMEAMNELAAMDNVSMNLVAIGMEVGRLVPLPPGMESATLEDVLMLWDELYYAVHGDYAGDIGHIECEKISDTHYQVTNSDLYPDDLAYGIIFGYARRFLPQGTAFKVFYDPDAPQRDRDGAPSTVLHVTWD